MKHTISWLDSGREPKCPPNPEYPDGIDLDMSNRAETMNACRVELPYPARRCGVYIVKCETCGLAVGITTAGRPDDPRSVVLACLRKPS